MPRPVVALPCGSRSARRVGRPARARPAARLTAVVVLPTPPFWLTTASVLRRSFSDVSRQTDSDRQHVAVGTFDKHYAADACSVKVVLPLGGHQARSDVPRQTLCGGRRLSQVCRAAQCDPVQARSFPDVALPIRRLGRPSRCSTSNTTGRSVPGPAVGQGGRRSPAGRLSAVSLRDTPRTVSSCQGPLSRASSPG
jgi:hypothetical protein